MTIRAHVQKGVPIQYLVHQGQRLFHIPQSSPRTIFAYCFASKEAMGSIMCCVQELITNYLMLALNRIQETVNQETDQVVEDQISISAKKIYQILKVCNIAIANRRGSEIFCINRK